MLPTGLMVPDGGQACADVRWYCQDTKSCTERWTASLPRTAPVAPAAGDAYAGGQEPGAEGAADPVPAELLGGAPEEA